MRPLNKRKGGTLIRLHQTRLMRPGEVALWHHGTIVWQGSVGATINNIVFDAVSINVEDGQRLTGLTDGKAFDAVSVVAALADWWD